MITVFYGMSGSLKLTTMTTSPDYKNSYKVLSDIKPHYGYIKKYFKTIREASDIDFMIHRLLELDEPYLKEYKEISIERGVTDYLHSFSRRDENLSLKLDIEGLVSEESRLLEKCSNEIKKVLLIMSDEKFIESEILKEPTRLARYKNLETYLRLQDDYVEFTKNYNIINETIDIKDAMNYINNLKNGK